MYVFFFVWKALFLQLLPPVAAISNPTSIIRAIGEDVVFTFNASTYIKDVIWGLRDGETSNLKQPLMSGLLSSGVKLNPNMPQHYAGRVSFVGNLTKGEAWFKITNLNMNDTNEYMAKLLVKDATNYENIPVKLIVILPATVPTTMHLLTSTKTRTWITEGLTTTFQTTTSSGLF